MTLEKNFILKNIGKRGDTPLMMVLRNSEKATKKFESKYLPKIEALYHPGASLDVANNKGKTVRVLIEESSHKDVIKRKLSL